MRSNDTEIQTAYVFALRKCNADVDLAQKNIWAEIDTPEHSPVSKASLWHQRLLNMACTHQQEHEVKLKSSFRSVERCAEQSKVFLRV